MERKEPVAIQTKLIELQVPPLVDPKVIQLQRLASAFDAGTLRIKKIWGRSCQMNSFVQI